MKSGTQQCKISLQTQIKNVSADFQFTNEVLWLDFSLISKHLTLGLYDLRLVSKDLSWTCLYWLETWADRCETWLGLVSNWNLSWTCPQALESQLETCPERPERWVWLVSINWRLDLRLALKSMRLELDLSFMTRVLTWDLSETWPGLCLTLLETWPQSLNHLSLDLNLSLMTWDLIWDLFTTLF